MCNLYTSTMAYEAPTQKCGYLEIKQSAKVKPRKLKAWRRRWIVLTKMSDLSNEQYVAKLDLYDNETKWRNKSTDKTTFMLENVTSIQSATSRTRPHAFEIVEKQPVLVLSGSSELESYSWTLTLQQILTPHVIQAKKGSFKVTIRANQHSSKWSLIGDYNLTVSPTCVSLVDGEGTSVISWGLSTLMKFNVENDPISGDANLMVIECGPNAPTGHSLFHFLSDEASDILAAIKQSICLALAQKECARRPTLSRPRTLSATVSEKNFQKLLDDHPVFPDMPRERTDSESSGSTLGSPLPPVSPLMSPGSVSMTRSGSVLGVLTESDETARVPNNSGGKQELKSREPTPPVDVQVSELKDESSALASSSKDSGYSEIKEHPADGVPRRYTISSEPQEIDFDRLRSVSAVAASLKEANPSAWEKLDRDFEGENDDRSDLDSAIASMALSTTNEDLPKKEQPHYQELGCAKREDPFPYGGLNRRRSSSTPDFQAYRKRHAAVSKFENVYEELDELKASVRRLNMKRDSDTPPELPARPCSMSFTSHTNLNAKAEKTKKSLFKKQKSFPSYDSERSKEKLISQCTCHDNPGKSRTGSGSAQCPVCGGRESKFKLKSSASKSISHEELIASGGSSMSDIYASIPDLNLSKRRRSSDITPAMPPLITAASRSNSDQGKTSSLPTPGKDRGDSIRFGKSHEHVSLISFDVPDSTDKSPSGAKPVKQSSADDPLISFFLDDESFSSNPMVTGELTPASAQPTASFNIFNDDFNTNFQQQPFTPGQFNANTLPTLQRQNAVTTFPPTPCPLPMSPGSLNPFPNPWNRLQRTQNVNMGMSSPTNFYSPFMPVPFTWNLSAIGSTPPINMTQVAEGNYIPMMNSRGKGPSGELSPHLSAISNENGTEATATAEIFNVPSVSTSEQEEVYVSPSNISKVK